MIRKSEVSSLGDGVKPLSDLFFARKYVNKNQFYRIYGEILFDRKFILYTDIMAAIEIGTKREEMIRFTKFMADLQLQQSNNP